MTTDPFIPANSSPPLLLFREPIDSQERAAVAAFLGERAGPSGRLFVLVELADARAALPVAAALVVVSGAVWRVARGRGRPSAYARMGEELVRAATSAGAAQLVASPREGSAASMLRLCPLAAVERGEWVLVDL